MIDAGHSGTLPATTKSRCSLITADSAIPPTKPKSLANCPERKPSIRLLWTEAWLRNPWITWSACFNAIRRKQIHPRRRAAGRGFVARGKQIRRGGLRFLSASRNLPEILVTPTVLFQHNAFVEADKTFAETLATEARQPNWAARLTSRLPIFVEIAQRTESRLSRITECRTVNDDGADSISKSRSEDFRPSIVQMEAVGKQVWRELPWRRKHPNLNTGLVTHILHFLGIILTKRRRNKKHDFNPKGLCEIVQLGEPLFGHL
jgi:hypothetical protein